MPLTAGKIAVATDGTHIDDATGGVTTIAEVDAAIAAVQADADAVPAGVMTLTNKTLTSPKVNEVLDTNGNEVVKFGVTAVAVNEVTVTNAATAGKPKIAATGGDTNIDLVLATKGTGTMYLDNGSASNLIQFDLGQARMRLNSSVGEYETDAANNAFSDAGLQLKQTGVVSFSSAGAFYNGADTGLARNAAGVIEANNGTAGTLRDFKARTYFYTATVFDTSGAGTPEGAVAAGIGSTYRRTDGGALTSFYVKESGAGNTGWVAK